MMSQKDNMAVGSDPNRDEFDFARAQQAFILLAQAELQACIDALRELRSVDLTDKGLLIRAILCDQPGYGFESEEDTEDYALDLWVDRMTYVDEESFSLEVTQAEPNVFWKKRGRKPRRVEGALQRFLLRQGMLWKAPFIPLAYLNEMSNKLRQILSRDEIEAARYIDEYDLLSKNDEFVALLNKIMDGLSDVGTD